MLSIKKLYEKITIAGSVVSFVLFLLFVKLSGMSIGYIVNIQNSLLKSLIIDTSGQGTLSALSTVLGSFSSIFIALVFLVLSLAFVSSYGYFSTNKRMGVLIGLINASLSLVFFPSMMGLFIAISAIISVVYIIPLSNTYGKELRKWTKFRVGSNSISKVFLIINILLALGIMFSVISDFAAYQENFRQDLADTLTDITLASIPNAQMIDKSVIRSTIESSVENSQLFNAYFRWLPLSSAFGVWIIMEFLRNLILSNIGGIFTSGIIGFYSKRR